MRRDASATGRYDDAALLREFLLPQVGEIITDIQMSTQVPVLMLWAFSVTSSTRAIIVPPNVGSIYRVGRLDDAGCLTHDKAQGHEFSPEGPRWSLVGNELTFRPYPTGDEDWLLFYEPTGTCFPHAGTGTVGADGTIILDDAPALGELDWRPNAYAGAFLRILHSGCAIQERLIETYDVATRTATPRTDWASLGSVGLPDEDEDVDYEIVPLLGEHYLQYWIAKAALALGLKQAVAEKTAMALEYDKDCKLKSFRDAQSSVYLGRSKFLQTFTYRHPDFNNPEKVVLYGGNLPRFDVPLLQQ